MPDTLDFLKSDHPVHRVNPPMLRRLQQAQAELLSRNFGSPGDLCEEACRQAGVNPRLAEGVDGELDRFSNLPRTEMVDELAPKAAELGLSQAAVVLAADRVQLLRAFNRPDDVIEMVRAKVELVVRDFPRTAAQIERGKNPGDLLDPFIMAATQELMYGGSVEGAIQATASHKAMMMIEGLIGHLHEDVIGTMRGNVRVPEPRGKEQETLDLRTNPFPGADIAQPPWNREMILQFHQVKSKMGSAKGGDARRLGQQLQLLSDTYGARVYYDALIGKSLAGHRSKAGVLRVAPNVVVLVGQAAFEALTGSSAGAELLLRVYQHAFQDVAKTSGYTIQTIAAAIAEELRDRAGQEGDDFLQVLLRDVTSGELLNQDSRTYRGLRARRT